MKLKLRLREAIVFGKILRLTDKKWFPDILTIIFLKIYLKELEPIRKSLDGFARNNPEAVREIVKEVALALNKAN